MANGDVHYFRVAFKDGDSVIWSWSADDLRAHHPPRSLAEEREAQHALEQCRAPRTIVSIERLRRS